MPAVNVGSHLRSCASDVSPFASPSATVSAAIAADARASSTPDEDSGSRNPKASPLRHPPSPAPFLPRTVGRLHPHADGTGPREEPFAHPPPREHLNAVLAGVVEGELVELAAADLPGLRCLVRPVVDEVERLRQLAPLVDELDAVLL